ncbi:MAG: hypothetical protein AAF581_22395 [Planctomycetota bacterium]
MKRLSASLYLLVCMALCSGAHAQFGIPFPNIPGPGAGNGLNLSITDTTTDLGLPFQMVVSADAMANSPQGGFSFSVDSTQILITGWSPGVGLSDYLAANGPIGCDDTNDGTTLSVFFFFNAPYDAATFGTEFVIIDCLAIAQQTGSTTATLIDTFSGSTSTATVNFPGGTPIDPAQIPQPPQPPNPMPTPQIDFPTYSIADVTATIGGSAALSVDATAANPVIFTSFMIDVDPTQLTITSVDPGAGLTQYINDNGPIPCDITMNGSQAFVSMLFLVPFDTAIYGTDYVQINCDVVATTPGTADVTLLDDQLQPTVATVTIDGPVGDAFLRGDSNVDGSCNIADAVNMLNFLFNSGTVACMDAADLNDDGSVNIADPLSLLDSIFNSATPLVETCADDTTLDTLDCANPGC